MLWPVAWGQLRGWMIISLYLYAALRTIKANDSCPLSMCSSAGTLLPHKFCRAQNFWHLGSTFPSLPTLLTSDWPTWSCGSAPGKCHQPCHSQRPHEPWLCRACRPPGLWPWPPLHAARRTGPSSASSWGQPTPSAHGRGRGSGWSRGHPSQCPLLLHAS